MKADTDADSAQTRDLDTLEEGWRTDMPVQERSEA